MCGQFIGSTCYHWNLLAFQAFISYVGCASWIICLDLQLTSVSVGFLKVYGLPTLLLFKNGEEVEGSKHEGAITKEKLIEYLEKCGIVALKR